MTVDAGFPRAAYIELRLDKYEQHRKPGDGPPDETIVTGQWVDFATHEPIVDPAHLAFLAEQYGKVNTEEPDGGG